MLTVITAALAIEYTHSRAMIVTAIAAIVALNGQRGMAKVDLC